MGKMTVYHGSYLSIQKPAILKGRNTKDFGPGFYYTVIREQAERRAKRFTIISLIIWTVFSPESNSGSWPNLNIPHTR